MLILLLTTVFASTCIVEKYFTDNTCATAVVPEQFSSNVKDETCRIGRMDDAPESEWKYARAVCENGEPKTFWMSCTTNQCSDEEDSSFCLPDGYDFSIWNSCSVVPLGRGIYSKYVCEPCEDLPCGYMNIDGTPSNTSPSCTSSPTTSPTTAPTWAPGTDLEVGCVVQQLYSDDTCETETFRVQGTLGFDATCRRYHGLGIDGGFAPHAAEIYAKGTCTYAPDGTTMSIRVWNLCTTDQCLDEGDYSCGADGQDYSHVMNVCRNSIYATREDTYEKYLCRPCDQLTCDVKAADGTTGALTTQLNPNAAEDPMRCPTSPSSSQSSSPSTSTFSLLLALVASVFVF